MTDRFDVVVVGGGPAGSVAARSLAAAGYSVALLEKQRFPRETLCGEFLSAEVAQTISDMGLESEFQALRPNPLKTFTLLPDRSRPISSSLGFTAYGVKRGAFDAMLLEAAGRAGVTIIQPAEVTGVERDQQEFVVACKYHREERTYRSRWVIGAYGKSSPLDKRLGRSFAGTRTGYTGFKYHIPAGMIENLGNDEIAIALGPRIYCGISRVGGETVTLCALERREKGDVSSRERLGALARANPSFARLVTPAVLNILANLSPYGTGNLFFGTRVPVVNGVLMAGDSAGLIAPLAGDGIGIAMQQGRLIGRLFAEVHPRPDERESFYETYRRESAMLFAHRKRIALLCQRIALSEAMRLAVTPVLALAPGLLKAAVRETRGRVEHQHILELT